LILKVEFIVSECNIDNWLTVMYLVKKKKVFAVTEISGFGNQNEQLAKA